MSVRQKRFFGILLAVVLLPVLVFGIRFGLQIRQQRLDRAMIEAIMRQDTPTAISLLNRGADANARDRPYQPMTLKSLLTEFWNRRKDTHPEEVQNYRPALRLIYSHVRFQIPDTSLLEEEMLTSGVDTSEPYSHANTETRAGLILALLEHGADLRTQDRVPNVSVGDVVLDRACICNDAKAVKVLLEHHVDPNKAGEFGYSPLMSTEDYECTSLLLQAGADANARISVGRTRLMYLPNTKLYPLLLAHRANLNAQDDDGETALVHLFKSHYVSDNAIRAGMRFLIQNGAKVSLKDNWDKTALDYAKAGPANWMYPGAKGRYQRENILFLEAAMKRELEQKRRQKESSRQ